MDCVAKFDSFQLKEIEKGEQSGLNTSVYANPDFEPERMWCIRNLMLRNIDYSEFMSFDLCGDEMLHRYKELKGSVKNG